MMFRPFLRQGCYSLTYSFLKMTWSISCSMSRQVGQRLAVPKAQNQQQIDSCVRKTSTESLPLQQPQPHLGFQRECHL